MPVHVTPQRFAQGMTFAEYVAYIGTPANLARTTNGAPRRDLSDFFAPAFKRAQLTGAQSEILDWLVAQPYGPAKLLVIAEDWSSDCRRDVPTLARMAAVSGIELRIFNRDGPLFSDRHTPSPQESPNADLMTQFLNHKDGDTWQSIPVAAFFTSDFEYLYHYTEYPAIYEKDRLRAHMQQRLPGESEQQAASRYLREFQALQDSPFFRVWASAAVDTMLSDLQRRLVLGAV